LASLTHVRIFSTIEFEEAAMFYRAANVIL